MGQAEWLMILTCAGYVAPYAWDRLRTEWRNRTPVIQLNTSALHEINAEIDHAIAQVRDASRSQLRASIQVSERCFTCGENERRGNEYFTYCMGPPCEVSPEWWNLYRKSGASWADAYRPQKMPEYVLTSGDKDCRTCVNISTAQDHTDRYECTGSCRPVERPQYWPAGTF